MADDQIQRSNFRTNETPARPASATSGSDPLAELARLIGQTDPFGEYGRNNVRRAGTAAEAPSVPPRQAAHEYVNDAPAAAPAQMPPPADDQAYARAPYAGAADYHSEHATPEYAAEQDGGYEAQGYRSQPMPPLAEHEDMYDDVPPSRRRLGVLAVAAVFTLAVVGVAGAFGYRALFGSSGARTPPPVIKADTAPSKIVPATAAKTPNKLIYDRVADRGPDEKLVSREEQPVELKDQAPAAAPPAPGQDSASSTPPVAATGTGIVSTEPKKIRTIAIHPDQLGPGESQPVAAAPTASPPALPASPQAASPPVPRAAPAKPAAAPPLQVANNPPEPTPPPRPAETRATPPARHTAAPARSNAPLSLSPDANPAAAPAAKPARTAAAAPTTPARTASVSSGASGSYVQLSSQRSEAEAQAAFRGLQAKFPNQLGGRQLVVRKVELGAKGTYYRAMVGPLAASEATELCGGLKAAGGQCLIQRN